MRSGIPVGPDLHGAIGLRRFDDTYETHGSRAVPIGAVEHPEPSIVARFQTDVRVVRSDLRQDAADPGSTGRSVESQARDRAPELIAESAVEVGVVEVS